MVDITPDTLVAKLANVSVAAHKGALKGMQKACLERQRTAMKYCTPGSSPFDPMNFPSKVDRINNATGKKSVRISSDGSTEANYTGAPFDHGLLRANIYIRVTDEQGKICGGIGCGFGKSGPGTKPGYALHVHQGTSKMFARPFIRKAIEDEAQLTKVTLGQETWNAVKEASLL
jgi:hypothetical protein